MKTKIEKERKEIFKLFLKSNKLKFAEIEKLLKIRSNFLAYYLKNMQKDELIDKKGDYYCLNKNAEKYLPVLSQINDVGPLPVILVGLINENKILLMKGKIRPSDLWLIQNKLNSKIDVKSAFLVEKNGKYKLNLN